jgi:hypothetical protein
MWMSMCLRRLQRSKCHLQSKMMKLFKLKNTSDATLVNENIKKRDQLVMKYISKTGKFRYSSGKHEMA